MSDWSWTSVIYRFCFMEFMHEMIHSLSKKVIKRSQILICKHCQLIEKTQKYTLVIKIQNHRAMFIIMEIEIKFTAYGSFH